MTTAILSTTVFAQGLSAEGQPEFVGTWHPEFDLAYNGYRVRTYGRQGQWCVADASGTRFGAAYDSMQDVIREIDQLAESDRQDREWSWFVGCEWRSELLAGLPSCDESYGSVLFENGDEPGSAHAAAQKLYQSLCREPGGCGMVWIGRIDPDRPEDDDERFMEQESCERDPAQEEEDRQAAYEQYLEDHHDELVQQDRYEAWKREF